MRTKVILVLCVLMGITPITCIGWYCWDSARNRGFEFRYFGVFNRVRHALTAMPGVAITRDWANDDVTLEEFSFDITTRTGKPMRLFFQESDPVRDLSGQQLAAALSARIQQEIPSTSPTHRVE